MKYIVLIYNDPALLGALSPKEVDSTLRVCFDHTHEMEREGRLLESQMLAPAETARSIRVRNGRSVVSDGPFAEAKEVLGGYNIIEAGSMDEALSIAMEFPWAETGCIEVRAIQDLDAVRARVGAATSASRS